MRLTRIKQKNSISIIIITLFHVSFQLGVFAPDPHLDLTLDPAAGPLSMPLFCLSLLNF